MPDSGAGELSALEFYLRVDWDFALCGIRGEIKLTTASPPVETLLQCAVDWGIYPPPRFANYLESSGWREIPGKRHSAKNLMVKL
jgi:hypothetical protein